MAAKVYSASAASIGFGTNAHLLARRHVPTTAADLRPHPVLVRDYPFPQPRAGARQPRLDADRPAVALDGHALGARHHRSLERARHPHLARALQARRPRHAEIAALGVRAGRARAPDPVLALSAHRQHAHRAHLLRRQRHLHLRARQAVASERHRAEHAAHLRVGARLPRHPLLAAPLRRPTGARCRSSWRLRS